MNKIALISGCPCAGKTTFLQALVSSEEKRLFLPLNAFFAFLVHPIPPTLPESHQQNISNLKSGARVNPTAGQLANRAVMEPARFSPSD